MLVWTSAETCALYMYRLTSTGAGLSGSSAQLNFEWRSSWVRVCAFAFHVTTVPLLASRAAMLRQRVATAALETGRALDFSVIARRYQDEVYGHAFG